jgi:shikimate kinase
MRKSIFLVGFRCTGKTTVGQILARKLKTGFFDMDELIEKETGKSINEITKDGKSWREFRQMEQDLIFELAMKEGIVVGMGGGALVNDMIKKGTDKTYGELNRAIINDSDKAELILLVASDEVIKKRIINDESNKKVLKRPILDERRAFELEKKLKKTDNGVIKQKDLLISEVITDSLIMYEKRKPLYFSLTPIVVDTSMLTPDEVADEIIKKIKP